MEVVGLRVRLQPGRPGGIHHYLLHHQAPQQEERAQAQQHAGYRWSHPPRLRQDPQLVRSVSHRKVPGWRQRRAERGSLHHVPLGDFAHGSAGRCLLCLPSLLLPRHPCRQHPRDAVGAGHQRPLAVPLRVPRCPGHSADSRDRLLPRVSKVPADREGRQQARKVRPHIPEALQRHLRGTAAHRERRQRGRRGQSH